MAEEQETWTQTVGTDIMCLSASKEVRSFFDVLPQELRDCVYDLLSEDVNENVHEYVRHISLQAHVSIPKLRPVSRQFKAEYEAQCSRNDFNHLRATLSIPEAPSISDIRVQDLSRVRYLSPLHRTTSMTLVISPWMGWEWIKANGYRPTEITAFEEWMEKLGCKLPRLQRMQITIDVEPCHGIRVRDMMWRRMEYWTPPKIKMLEFWTSVKIHPKPILLANWTSGHAWQQDKKAMTSYFE